MNKMIWHLNTGHGQEKHLLADPAFSRMALDKLMSDYPYQYQRSHFFLWKDIKYLLSPSLENTSKANIKKALIFIEKPLCNIAAIS